MSYKISHRGWKLSTPSLEDEYVIGNMSAEEFIVDDAGPEFNKPNWMILDSVRVCREQWLVEHTAASTVARRFSELKQEWQEASAFLPRLDDAVKLWSYQQIIGIGPAVVPFILQSLQQDPDHWFWALSAITGEDPVDPNDRGDITLMANAWIDWGKKKKLIR